MPRPKNYTLSEPRVLLALKPSVARPTNHSLIGNVFFFALVPQDSQKPFGKQRESTFVKGLLCCSWTSGKFWLRKRLRSERAKSLGRPLARRARWRSARRVRHVRAERHTRRRDCLHVEMLIRVAGGVNRRLQSPTPLEDARVNIVVGRFSRLAGEWAGVSAQEKGRLLMDATFFGPP